MNDKDHLVGQLTMPSPAQPSVSGGGGEGSSFSARSDGGEGARAQVFDKDGGGYMKIKDAGF